MPSPSGSIAAQYAQQWADADSAPDVVEFLRARPGTSAREMADVLLVDQRLRWTRGIGQSVDEYFRRFPEVADDEALRLELVTEEYDYRTRAGESIDADQLLSRYSETSDLELSKVFRQVGHDEIASPTDLICALFAESDVMPALMSELTGSVAARLEEVKRKRRDVPPLGKCEVFSALPTKVVRRIEGAMVHVEFPEGEIFIRQGTPGTSLVVITEGVADIVSADEGGERHLIGRAGRGHVLGEMSLLGDQPRSADAIARTIVKALELPAETFHQLAQQHPQICVVLTNLVASRLGGRGRDALADKMLSGYRIKRRLGRGGMAVVYEAIETASDRHVALKMMSHRLVYDEEALNRFQREADIVESFDHPNICQTYGRFAAFHTYFIVMEFCDGVTLYELLQHDEDLPQSEIKKIVGQIAAALQHAHRAGIAHRDIKPSNVMMLRDGTVKLMDFGLATPVDGDDADENDGSLIGTPRYMAPEQLLGGRAIEASDYFSLGALVHELITHRPLFETNDFGELLQQHSAWNPDSFGKVCPAADEHVQAAFAQALNKDLLKRNLDLDTIAAWAASIDMTTIDVAHALFDSEWEARDAS
ncbi:MAG TPA: protein kinase [Pirellulales bacterium]|nr:protein kinase [Pirellulales bacterium]